MPPVSSPCSCTLGLINGGHLKSFTEFPWSYEEKNGKGGNETTGLRLSWLPTVEPGTTPSVQYSYRLVGLSQPWWLGSGPEGYHSSLSLQNTLGGSKSTSFGLGLCVVVLGRRRRGKGGSRLLLDDTSLLSPPCVSGDLH